MGSDTVVIVSIGFQNSAQMRLAQDNDVVQTLAPDRSDQPFGKAILPGEAGAVGLSRMPMARNWRVATAGADTSAISMARTLLIAAAGALLATSASAAPLMNQNPAISPSSSTENVRLVCDEYGRCYRTRGPRYCSGGITETLTLMGGVVTSNLAMAIANLAMDTATVADQALVLALAAVAGKIAKR